MSILLIPIDSQVTQPRLPIITGVTCEGGKGEEGGGGQMSPSIFPAQELFCFGYLVEAGPSGRAAEDAGLQPLAC